MGKINNFSTKKGYLVQRKMMMVIFM